jgi:hypothetical protein
MHAGYEPALSTPGLTATLTATSPTTDDQRHTPSTAGLGSFPVTSPIATSEKRKVGGAGGRSALTGRAISVQLARVIRGQ